MIFSAIEDKGVVPLAWGENGFRQLSNSSGAIDEPADLEGLKIRVVARHCSRTPFLPWAPTRPR